MSYTIVPLSLENMEDLTYLYKHVFGNTITLDIVKRKFDTSYLGLSHFGHIAYHNNKPVAFHGAVPVLMTYNGATELAAQYGDAMTLPNHTGKGLFTKLGKLTDAQLEAAGITFVWGFPNQNSEYGYLNKLDWQYVERMQGFTIKTSAIPLEKIAQKFNFAKNIYSKRIDRIFEPYRTNRNIKGSVFLNTDCISTSRDSAYYNYKAYNDNFTVEIEGVLFWLKIKNGLLVGDIETPNDVAFYEALEKLKQIALNNGIGEITFQASPETQISKLLATKAENTFESWVVGYKSFSTSLQLEKLKLTFGDLDTF